MNPTMKIVLKLLVFIFVINCVFLLNSCAEDYTEDPVFIKCDIDVKKGNNYDEYETVIINLKSIFDYKKIEWVRYFDSWLSSSIKALDTVDVIELALLSKSSEKFLIDNSNTFKDYYLAYSGDFYYVYYKNGEQIRVYCVKGYLYILTDSCTYVSSRQVNNSIFER